MAHNTIVFRVKDIDADSQLAAFPVNVPSGLTIVQYQAYADAVAPELDNVTEGFIQSIDLLVSLTLPGGLAGVAIGGSQNERGGLITFSTPIPKKFSQRIPAIKHTIMAGDSFSLAQADIAALVTRLTTATTAAAIRPVTDFEENMSAALSGKKSQRRR